MAPALRMTHVTKASYKFFFEVLCSTPVESSSPSAPTTAEKAVEKTS